MKTILAIEAYYFSEKDFYEMREPVKDYPLEHFYNHLPEWCIRDDNGYINWTRAYHQWAGLHDVDGQKFILFNANPIDPILQEEISNVGFEDFFGQYDFRPLFKKLYVNEAPLRRLAIPHSQYIIVELTYHGDGEDCDLEVEVVGYLDHQMQYREVTF